MDFCPQGHDALIAGTFQIQKIKLLTRNLGHISILITLRIL